MTTILHVGDEFATPFESGCIVTSEPDQFGDFLARDHEGIECYYMLTMVTAVTPAEERAAMERERAAEYAVAEAAKGQPLAPWERELIGLPRDDEAPQGGESR